MRIYKNFCDLRVQDINKFEDIEFSWGDDVVKNKEYRCLGVGMKIVKAIYGWTVLSVQNYSYI